MKLYLKVQTKKQRASTFTSLEIQKMLQCQIINSTQAWVKILDEMHLGNFMPISLFKEKVSDVFVQGGWGGGKVLHIRPFPIVFGNVWATFGVCCNFLRF